MSSSWRGVRGLLGGALVSTLIGAIACATGGAKCGGEVDPATSPEASTTAATATAPRAAATPAAPAAPTPSPAVAANPAAPAQPAPGAATGAAESPVAAYLTDPAAIQRASQLFRAVCTGYCHSTQAAADRVAPNLFDCEWTHGSSDQQIFHSISAGIPDTQMQGFGERLPHEDLWKMVAYLRQKSTCK